MNIDKKKAKHYYELAAMMGSAYARHNLGGIEYREGNNIHRAYKHFILAARAGEDNALDVVKAGFMDGIITKDGYAQTLRAYQKSQGMMKSEARDKAATA